MKTLLLISISVFFINPSSFAQNWAPFNYNKKILYGTPDTLGGLLVGQSLALVRFDTITSSGSMFCKNGLGPDEFLATLGSAKSLVSLYGREMILQGNNYLFLPHQLQEESVLYNTKAELGEMAISSSTFSGVVVSKLIDFVNNQLDSIKVIQIIETRSIGHTFNYTARISKTRGFLNMPSFFFNTYDIKPEFSYFGDYDKNIKGIKSFNSQINRFEVGDILIYRYYFENFFGTSFIFKNTDTIKTQVLSISGDSCMVLDSIKSFDQITNNIRYAVINRKIENMPKNYFVNSSDLLISTQVGYSVKAAFMSNDSCMFIGFMQCALGLADNGGSSLISTQFPISLKVVFNLFSISYNDFPIYFKRGNTTFGQPINFNFTSVAESLVSKLSVFPNPTSNRLHIKGLPYGSAIVSLYNLQGKEVMKKSLSSEVELEISALPKGLYYLKIECGSRVYTDKVIKE